jgi:hypothetical protein
MYYNALSPYGQGAVRRYTWSALDAEYAWNPDLPDAERNFTVWHRYYDHGVRNSTDYQKQYLIPRVVHRLWGESGDAFAGLLKNNVSFFYIAEPNDMLGSAHRERFLDPYEYYKEQVQAVKTAQKKINKLISDMAQGRVEGVHGPLQSEPMRYEQAMNLYWTTNLAAIKGHVQWQWIRARRLAQQGRNREAEWALEQLLKDVPDLRKQLRRVRMRVKIARGLEWEPGVGHRWSGQGFLAFDLQKRKQAIEQRLEKVRSGVNKIPESMVD